MFRLSVILAIVISVITLLKTPVLLGAPIIALSLCGYAFMLLERGKPAKTRVNLTALWVAIAISILALVAAPFYVMLR
jgi:hypothetical protein